MLDHAAAGPRRLFVRLERRACRLLQIAPLEKSNKNPLILSDGGRRLALAKKPMDMDSPPVPGTENRTIKPPTQLWGEYFCRTLSDVPETNMGSHGPKSPDSQAPFWHCPCPTTPRLVREPRLSESMDFTTDDSSGAIWRNLSEDPSILTDELRGPAAAWTWTKSRSEQESL